MKILYQYNEKTGRVYRVVENLGVMFLQTLVREKWVTIKTVSDREYETSYRSEAEAWQRGERP